LGMSEIRQFSRANVMTLSVKTLDDIYTVD
jgi:hypothetical protein